MQCYLNALPVAPLLDSNMVSLELLAINLALEV